MLLYSPYEGRWVSGDCDSARRTNPNSEEYLIYRPQHSASQDSDYPGVGELVRGLHQIIDEENIRASRPGRVMVPHRYRVGAISDTSDSEELDAYDSE